VKYDLEYVLDSALDGIFIVAQDGRLVLFNKACKELFGISPEQVVGKACLVLPELKASLLSLATNGRSVPFGELAGHRERILLPCQNGKTVAVETTYTPIYDREDGEIAYVMGVIKDITTQKNLEDEKTQLLEQLDSMRTHLEMKYNFSNIMGRSTSILKALKLTAEVAKQNTTVLLLGESGTGKELMARAIHFNSRRASRPFVTINCSAFPDTLIESELFGYEKGAFTGADKFKPGKVKLASGGTLFLDEVTELSLAAQAKILRLLQEREYEVLGGVETVKADIRIIAATNRDPLEMVKEGKFREDLYYRLYVFPITLPPLRERTEDLPVLIDALIEKMHHEMGKNIKGLTKDAMKVLAEYPWPGNIRELQNVIERLMILAKKDWIGVSDLPSYLIENQDEGMAVDLDLSGEIPNVFSLEKHIQNFESKLILNALQKAGFNKAKAARTLGLTRSTFRYKLSKLPISKSLAEVS
jgi:PAS domain S-box-containing protein